MDEIFIYNKSIEERLADFNDILGSQNKVLPASKVKNEWCLYLELVIERAGWRALWKIPRSKCELYDITYPNVVIAYIEDVSFINLTAQIKVIAVKNNIHLPDTIEAKLTDLYPTIEQDTSIALDIGLTAENLENYRFFYHNIWMPWDEDREEFEDWPSQHLESRLRLYFDLKTGFIPKSIATKIKYLITEGCSIVERYQDLEDDDSDNENINDIPAKKICELARLHLRLVNIRTEFDIYEKAEIRDAIIKEENQEYSSKEARSWLILPSTKTVSEHIEYLQNFSNIESIESVPQIASSLTDACKNSNVDDQIYLPTGVFVMNSLDDLASGGKICGIYGPHNTTITDQHNSQDIFLSMAGSKLTVRNVTFSFKNTSLGFSFRQGNIHFINCVFETTKKNSRGFIIHPNVHVTFENCRIHDFDIAIVCKPESSLNIIENTIISRNNIGIVLYDTSKVLIKGSTISQSEDYGLCVQTTNGNPLTLTDNEFKEMFPTVQISSAIINENKKGNFRTVRKMKSISEMKSFESKTDVEMECDSTGNTSSRAESDFDLSSVLITKNN